MAFAAGFAIFLVLQVSMPPAKARIEGMTVRAGTNEPVARVRISAMRVHAPADLIPPVTSDGQGHFTIENLDADRYIQSAERNGFPNGLKGFIFQG
jgi:hypothetical protein